MQRDDATSTLLRAQAGDREALDALYPVVYDELRRMARRAMRNERPEHTLSTTALVHEAFLKLVDQTRVEWKDRAHFAAISARAMRQILVDHARRRNANKRGGGAPRLDLDEAYVVAEHPEQILLDLHENLEALGEHDERMARVVECRFFGGMSAEETAAALGVSLRTTERSWTRAKAYLYQALTSGEEQRAGGS